MKKIKLIFFVIIISIFTSCYDPPSRESQGLEYNSLLELINFYNLSAFFELVKGTDNFHARGKERIAGNILKSLNAQKNEVLFIGDTNMDVEIAQKYNTNITRKLV